VSPSRTLPVFNEVERELAQKFLAMKVAQMMGRKLEEADWSDVYCAAKGIPPQKWSNLNIDIDYDGLGVEHKMLCYRSKPTLEEACGTTLMHPSLTRSIRIPTTDADPMEVMNSVFGQYSDLINDRRRSVEEKTQRRPVDMRIGWLLWQESLRQFLYFEEPMDAPNPANYFAEWKDAASSVRKGSRNLWIYEKDSGRKRYSVTTSAGIKIQPYFDAPPPVDPNLYIFTVIGEQVDLGVVRIWLTPRTHLFLRRVTQGDLGIDELSRFVSTSLLDLRDRDADDKEPDPNPAGAVPLLLRERAYLQLKTAFPGVNDDHCFQLFLDALE
jgi:hypothetical protein